MPKIIILVGPPGSGKSIKSVELNKSLGFERISQDDMGKDGHIKKFLYCLANKDDIVIDRMNFDKKQRERYLKPAREAGYETEIVVFHVPRQVCFERIMARENHPTINGISVSTGQFTEVTGVTISEKEKVRQANSALDTFFTKYERVEDTEADKVTRLGWSGLQVKSTTIICDLDGTMCNIEHRLHHVKHEIKKHNRWDLFNKEIVNDTVNEWCRELVMRFYSASGNGYRGKEIVLCSGRVDSSRKDTEEWLHKNGILYEHLFMRHRNDFRQDYIIKEVILDFEILTRYNVLFAIDDRKQVVDLWRRRGIVCLACAEGDF